MSLSRLTPISTVYKVGLTLNSWNRKSSFLNRPEFLDGKFDHSVLVLGGDWMGDEIAGRLRRLGLDVTLATLSGSSNGSGEVSDVTLDSIHGQIGQFHARLIQGGRYLNRSFGFVVVSQPASMVPRFARYGLQKGPRVLSVSELEATLDSGKSLPEKRGLWYHAAFIDDLAGDSDPSTFARFLDVIERLQSIDKFQPYVFTRYLKVAAEDLEQRYRKIRELGAVFFKFDDDGPVFEIDANEWKILFTEPLLKLDCELTPDVVVLDEEVCAPAGLTSVLADLLPLETCKPYIQSESPRFNGVLTSKVGLFAVGPSRGVFDKKSIAEDIDALEVEVRKSLAMIKGISDLTPVVDKSKCAFCLTCLRLCPHGAITFYNRAEISSNSCQQCGICVVECPMGAISFQNQSQTPDTEKIGHVLNAPLSTSCNDKIVLFLCSRSAAQAFKAVEFIYQDDVVVFEVNCAGSIEPQRIFDALKSGARGVLVGGCYKGNCASLYGNILCMGRIENIAGSRKEKAPQHENSSISPELLSFSDKNVLFNRIRFVQTAGNTPEVLVKAISELGRLPV